MADPASSVAASPPPPPPPPVGGANPAVTNPANPAADIVRGATDPASGRVDTQALAAMVADAARTDPRAAALAAQQIEGQLSLTDGGRFARDLAATRVANDNSNAVPGPSITGAAFGAARAGAEVTARGTAEAARGATMVAQGTEMAARGTQTLVNNPILSVRWEGTMSAYTNRGGLTQPLIDRLQAGGITVAPGVNPIPPGSQGRAPGITAGVANNINGPAAESAIAQRLTAQGYTTTVAPGAANTVPNPNTGSTRVIDVVATRPAANGDPRMAERLEVESKVGRTSNSTNPNSRISVEVEADIRRLADNRTTRAAGEALETAGGSMRTAGQAVETAGETLSRGGRALNVVGRVAKPVGVVLDAIEIGSAYQADGNRVGENTGRAISGVAGGAAGGYGGALAGAAIGTAIFPGVGTVVGGIVGGVAGAFAGDAAGRGLFGTIRSWF